jgi:hypothetical protein
MKRRTNPANRRNLLPRIQVDGPPLSDEELTRLIWDQLDASSDADGWLLFQTSFFPSMTCAHDLENMRQIEVEFLADRGLSVEFCDGQVLLLKGGNAIAGCTPNFYTSPSAAL